MAIFAALTATRLLPYSNSMPCEAGKRNIPDVSFPLAWSTTAPLLAVTLTPVAPFTYAVYVRLWHRVRAPHSRSRKIELRSSAQTPPSTAVLLLMQSQSKIESACGCEPQTRGRAAQCHRGRKQKALVDANTIVTATLFMPPQSETLKATVCAKNKVISALFMPQS